jgi:hypothetical protein
MNVSHYSGSNSLGKKASLIPMHRDLTTVRVRTKNNSFIYGEQSMNDQMNETSQMMDPHEINMMWQRKRQTQDKIQEYKETKLQM